MISKFYAYTNKFLCNCICFFFDFGKNFYIDLLSVRISGIKNISIGDNFASLSSLKLFADSGRIVIGNNCCFNTNVFIGASGGVISIGSNVLIGPNVVLRSSNHAFKLSKSLIRDQGHTSGSIIIEDDVWICAGCIIVPDTRLNHGCVIGAGSVVTSDTEPFGIYAGSPARLISYRN